MTQMTLLQISKAFCEQHPEVRKAWIDDGIKDVAVQDAATRAWVVNPAWAAQPGNPVFWLAMHTRCTSMACCM